MTEQFKVRFYDPERGGVWVRQFADRAEAERFAAGKRLHAKPAVVETAEVSP